MKSKSPTDNTISNSTPVSPKSQTNSSHVHNGNKFFCEPKNSTNKDSDLTPLSEKSHTQNNHVHRPHKIECEPQTLADNDDNDCLALSPKSVRNDRHSDIGKKVENGPTSSSTSLANFGSESKVRVDSVDPLEWAREDNIRLRAKVNKVVHIARLEQDDNNKLEAKIDRMRESMTSYHAKYIAQANKYSDTLQSLRDANESLAFQLRESKAKIKQLRHKNLEEADSLKREFDAKIKQCTEEGSAIITSNQNFYTHCVLNMREDFDTRVKMVREEAKEQAKRTREWYEQRLGVKTEELERSQKERLNAVRRDYEKQLADQQEHHSEELRLTEVFWKGRVQGHSGCPFLNFFHMGRRHHKDEVLFTRK